MADSITCDWCGHTIDDFSALNKMLCYGLPSICVWHLHLPRDGYDCMEQAVKEVRQDLRCRAAGRGDPHADGGNWRPSSARSSSAATLGRRSLPPSVSIKILNALNDARCRAREIAEKIAAPQD